jgi:hypothetical protein
MHNKARTNIGGSRVADLGLDPDSIGSVDPDRIRDQDPGPGGQK